MREKLNGNPVAQVAILGVLALVVGFLLLTRMGGSSEPAATPEATTTDPAATAPVDPATGVAPVTPAVPATPDAGAVPVPEASSDFKAGPGLPQPVVTAYDANKVVVMLVVTKDSVDDDKVKAITESLRKRSDTELFVVESKDVADYSRIAQGVDLQQTPALVVLQPKNLANGAQPMATIEYGFRGPDSVNQSVEDALYKGRNDLPYYPEG